MKNQQNQKDQQGRVYPHEISFLLDNPFRRLVQSPKKIVGEYIQKGDTIVDIGCGPGYFTIDMARMVGQDGHVFAVDLQKNMLNKARKKALKHNLDATITFHQCASSGIGLDVEADFVLAFHVIHETPDPEKTLSEIYSMLKPGGRLLTVEPKFHVRKQLFESMLEQARNIGFSVSARPSNKGGYGVLFIKE